MRGYTGISMKNVFKTKEFTCHNLNGIIYNKSLVILKWGKDSCVVIMDKLDYVSKFHNIIEEGINNDAYTQTNDTTFKVLKLFESFCYRRTKNTMKKCTQLVIDSRNI